MGEMEPEWLEIDFHGTGSGREEVSMAPLQLSARIQHKDGLTSEKREKPQHSVVRSRPTG